MSKALPNIAGPLSWTIGSESTTFDVDHSVGDSIQLGFTIDQTNLQEACRFLLFQFGDGKTYLSSGSSINRTFTFNSDGVTEVKIIGQPSFAGVTEVYFSGKAIDPSTIDGYAFGDLEIITLEATRGNDASPVTETFGDALTIIVEKGNNNNRPLFNASALSEGVETLNLFGTLGSSVWSDLPSSLIRAQFQVTSGFGGTTTEGAIPDSSMEFADLRGTSIDVDEEGLAADAGDTLKYLRQNNNNPTNLRTLIPLMPVLATIRHDARLTGDLSGVATSDGRPFLRSHHDRIDNGGSNTRFSKLPDDYSEVDNLLFRSVMNFDGSGGQTSNAYADNDTVNVSISAAWQDRSTLGSDTLIDLREHHDNISASTLSRDSLQRIIGVGSYPQDGLIDFVDFNHDVVFMYEVEFIDDSTNRIYLTGGDITQRDVRYDGATHTIDRFEVGSEFRLFGGGDEGVYTISQVSYDGTQTFVEVQETLSATTADQILAFTPIPNYFTGITP